MDEREDIRDVQRRKKVKFAFTYIFVFEKTADGTINVKVWDENAGLFDEFDIENATWNPANSEAQKKCIAEYAEEMGFTVVE